MTAGVALHSPGAVAEAKLSFKSGGKSIPVEAFQPAGEGKAPAIIVLHGAGGMDYGNAYVRHLATAFAEQGYATFLVHYFSRTGNSYASDSTIRQNFPTWLETVSDAVSFISKQPGVDAARLATFGYSLGGYLAVAHAAQDDRVRAVVELAGGIDDSYAKKVKRMPPTLIVHGKSDRRVEPERATELEQLLQGMGVPVEMKLYEGEGHMLSPRAALDALSSGLDFLNRHLR
jgi:dipeptidyl aminopeptidase/acylaminoacyl peptidase